ncbi:DUF305 domain-containing protein [Nocardioides pyridinolyticus]
MHTRRTAAALAATALLLAGCGDDDPGLEPDDGAPFNGADVEFATEMIQHHAMALVMVDQLREQKVSAKLSALGEQITAAQTSEIERMSDWLVDWDQPVPATDRDHANAHDMEDTDDPHMDMGGMSGPAFEDHWLAMMIDHHQDAVDMAEAQIEDGEFGDAVDLARSIVESQQAAIGQMEQLLEE